MTLSAGWLVIQNQLCTKIYGPIIGTLFGTNCSIINKQFNYHTSYNDYVLYLSGEYKSAFSSLTQLRILDVSKRAKS